MTMPEKLMLAEETIIPFLLSRMVELSVPLTTDREMLFTVCVRVEILPSASEIRLVRLTAVCCSVDTFPSSVHTELVRLFAVCCNVEIFPSALEIRDVTLSTST